MLRESIEEFITKQYLLRTKKNYVKHFDKGNIKLIDGAGKVFRSYPRWHLIIDLDNSKDFEEFNNKFYKIFTNTFFPATIKNNSFVAVYVKNHGKEKQRYIL